MVLGGAKIGKGSTVGTGSVMARDVPEQFVVAGNPVRIINRTPLTVTEAAGNVRRMFNCAVILVPDRLSFCKLSSGLARPIMSYRVHSAILSLNA